MIKLEKLLRSNTGKKKRKKEHGDSYLLLTEQRENMYKDFILKTKYGREDLNSFTFDNPSSIKKLEHEASFDINQAGDSK